MIFSSSSLFVVFAMIFLETSFNFEKIKKKKLSLIFLLAYYDFLMLLLEKILLFNQKLSCPVNPLKGKLHRFKNLNKNDNSNTPYHP
jgi:hypothetical protein